jgi:putative transcription factor
MVILRILFKLTGYIAFSKEWFSMECEICGIEIIGSPRKVVVEGTELEVCAKCARYGKTPDGWAPSSRKVSPVAPTPIIKKPKRSFFKDMDEDIISDYSQVIREAREAKGLTIEELGLNIKEKSSLIRKIERSEIMPEDSMRKKLEYALGIKLTERTSIDDMEHGSVLQGTTLGDIVKIKRK